MNIFLVMIEIVTYFKEIKTYFLLESSDIKDAQAIVDAYLRDNGGVDREFDYSMTSVEKLTKDEAFVFSQYVDFLPKQLQKNRPELKMAAI